MKRALIISVVVVVVLCCAIFAVWVLPHAPSISSPTPVQHLAPDAYPLYSGATWGPEEGTTFGDFVGYGISSAPVTNITDIASTSMPFEQYYAQKLSAAGWGVDNALAAGGPGSEIVGYRKGADVLIVSFGSVFKAGGVNEPEQCPCDVTMHVFSGALESTSTRPISQ